MSLYQDFRAIGYVARPASPAPPLRNGTRALMAEIEPVVAAGLRGKRAAMVLFSYYPIDPRPRRAAEALVSAGMTVDLVCLMESEREARREQVNGVNVHRLPLKRRRGGLLAYMMQYLAFLLMSSALLAVRAFTRGYDLVYVHNMPDILVLSGLVPKLRGAKVILDLHDPMPELMRTIFTFGEHSLPVRLLKGLEKCSIGFADAAITVNLACKKLFAARSCEAAKMHVVMNSPDDEIFAFRPVPTDRSAPPRRAPFVIMYHGSLVERNGLDLAVDALAKIRASIPEAELRIYGSRTPFLDRVLASARAQHVDDAVHYLGPKLAEDIVGAIADCDVGIIPNHRSIFTELNTPTRIFEYLAGGKPVIAPRAPGIQDYFGDDTLVFFELGDADDLARKIAHVHAHPCETLEIVRRAQHVYLAHTWSEERRALVQLADELVGTGVGHA